MGTPTGIEQMGVIQIHNYGDNPMEERHNCDYGPYNEQSIVFFHYLTPS